MQASHRDTLPSAGDVGCINAIFQASDPHIFGASCGKAPHPSPQISRDTWTDEAWVKGLTFVLSTISKLQDKDLIVQ